jgi:hypothetical protein
MPFARTLFSRSFFALTLAVAAVAVAPACGGSGGYRKGKKTEARQWLERPSTGKREGNKIIIAPIGVEFEIPDTLYVFKNCDEAGHAAGEGPEKDWVPVVTCQSGGAVSAADEDLGASAPSGDSEPIALTFYLAPKDRPVDERAVAFYRNQYQEQGLNIEDLAYNDDYFQKTGIFAKLQIMDEAGTTAVREIQQFMFPYGDVVFIARTEYPFGDTRAIQQDWKSIMPYFKVSLKR